MMPDSTTEAGSGAVPGAATSQPAASDGGAPWPLARRTPGLADLSVFTIAAPRAGRHRFDGQRPRLGVCWDPSTGRPLLRSRLRGYGGLPPLPPPPVVPAGAVPTRRGSR